MRRKGQSGTGTATLITIIAALIILYILFIPPAERAKLLGDDNETVTEKDKDTAKKTEELENETLLLEYPGSITYQQSSRKEYADFPTVYLSSQTTSGVIGEANAIFVERNIFKEKTESVRFDIENTEEVDSIFVSFKAKERDGILVLKVNGQTFYENRLRTTAVNPINIPKTELVNGENVLEITTNHPGLLFWDSNRYILENVQVITDVKQLGNLEAEVSFYVGEENSNVKDARVSFFPDCQTGTIGKLNIEINNKLLYSALPDCGMAKPISFDPTYIRQGQNNIKFTTSKGLYVLDSMRVETTLKEQLNPTYYFKISSDLAEDIEGNYYDAILTLNFADDDELKVADIVVNGDYFPISQRDSKYEEDISNYLQQGNNAIKIIPESNMDIIDIRVELEE